MKIFFFTGRNPKNKSGVSWKIWKIERKGCKVTTWWGPASILRRQVAPSGKLQPKDRTLSSEAAAAKFEAALIQRKLAKGYERKTRSRP